MPTPVPELVQLKNLLAGYTVAHIRGWLKRCELPSSAGTRDELIKKVHEFLTDGKLTMEGLEAALIGIQEATSKRTFLYQIGTSPKDLERIDKQLSDLKTLFSLKPRLAPYPTETTKVVYVVNGDTELRAKWTELHVRVTPDKKTRKWKEEAVPKVVVLIVNKMTGIVQLRFDKPEDEHVHKEEGASNKKAYFDSFLAASENLIGHSLQPIKLEDALEKILKTDPRIVRVVYAVDDSDDGGRTHRAQKHKNKDVRDLKEWKQQIDAGTIVRTFEEAPLEWIKEQTDGKLQRDVLSHVYCEESMVRFDPECYEEEIEYVLSHLVQTPTGTQVV